MAEFSDMANTGKRGSRSRSAVAASLLRSVSSKTVAASQQDSVVRSEVFELGGEEGTESPDKASSPVTATRTTTVSQKHWSGTRTTQSIKAVPEQPSEDTDHDDGVDIGDRGTTATAATNSVTKASDDEVESPTDRNADATIGTGPRAARAKRGHPAGPGTVKQLTVFSYIRAKQKTQQQQREEIACTEAAATGGNRAPFSAVSKLSPIQTQSQDQARPSPPMVIVQNGAFQSSSTADTGLQQVARDQRAEAERKATHRRVVSVHMASPPITTSDVARAADAPTTDTRSSNSDSNSDSNSNNSHSRSNNYNSDTIVATTTTTTTTSISPTRPRRSVSTTVMEQRPTAPAASLDRSAVNAATKIQAVQRGRHTRTSITQTRNAAVQHSGWLYKSPRSSKQGGSDWAMLWRRRFFILGSEQRRGPDWRSPILMYSKSETDLTLGTLNLIGTAVSPLSVSALSDKYAFQISHPNDSAKSIHLAADSFAEREEWFQRLRAAGVACHR